MPEARPLRILHLAKHAPTTRGGIETVVGELLTAFTRQPQPITVECHCYASHSSTQTLAPNVTVQQQRTTATIASAPISLALLRAWHRARRAIDVVHVHLPNPWAALLLLALPTPAAVVASVHAASTRYGPLQRPHAALMHRLMRRADTIIVSAHANTTALGLTAYRDKVRVVPYGIDPARLQAAHQPSPPDARHRVLFVGRLVYYKGLETLLAAAPSINAEIVLLGDGPQYPLLHRQAVERGLSDRVRFVRDADDAALARHLAACTVFVLPSSTTSESFGLSVLEAMAAGKPVVVTKLGTGLDESVTTADAGRIVPPNDPAALAQAINALLADPAERARLGAAGRRAFERRHTSDQMASHTLDVYRQATGIRQAARRSAVPGSPQR